mmetsp:Transcript_86138/g.162327  ORF Transcript_86138/g.162327 Transcript_86138/m.162327 type:complete len:91 (+) Transcript_86138:590-862(+)
MPGMPVDEDASVPPPSAVPNGNALGAIGIAAEGVLNADISAGGNSLIPGMQEAGAVHEAFSSPAMAPGLGIEVGGAGIAMAPRVRMHFKK